MRLTMGLKLNGVLVSLGLLAGMASFFAVVSHQVSDQEKILWQQSARTGRASLSAIDDIIRSLSQDIVRYAEEERGRSFFVKDIERQLLDLNWQSYALQDGIQAQQGKREGRFLFRLAPEGILADRARMRSLLDELGGHTRQLIESWRELRKIKARLAGYWGRARENKRLEYILLQMENTLGRQTTHVDGETIAGTLSARQKEFLTKRLPRWVEQLKTTDLAAAELLESLHGQMMLLMTLSDPVLSQGFKSGDGEMVTVPEVLGRMQVAYQNWVVHVDRQVSDLTRARRQVMIPIHDQLAQMHAAVEALERERAIGVVQTERFLSRGEQDRRYVLMGMGSLALLILVLSVCWVERWSRRLVSAIQAMSRRCDQTVHVSKAMAQGWQRHIFQVVEQVAALSRLSASMKTMLPAQQEAGHEFGREEKLLRESRALVDQGVRDAQDLPEVISDIGMTSAEIHQVVAAIGDALEGMDSLLTAVRQVPSEVGPQAMSSAKEKVERVMLLLNRVKAAVHYAEKILEDQRGGIDWAAGLSSKVNAQFMRLGEMAHQMMAMVVRLTEDDERQRACWAEVMRDMGRVVHHLQASAGEIKISRVLSDEVKGHVENLQMLAADLSGTMGLAHDHEYISRRDGIQEAESLGAAVVGRDEQEREKQRVRREQVEQYFESFLRSRQLAAPSALEETTVS